MKKEILSEALNKILLNENYNAHGFNFTKELKSFECKFHNNGEFQSFSYFVDLRGGNGDIQDHRRKANKVIRDFKNVDDAMTFLAKFSPKYCAAIPNLWQPDYGHFKAANVRKVFEQKYNMGKGCYMNLKVSSHYNWVITGMRPEYEPTTVFRVWLMTNEGCYAFGFQDKGVKDLQLVHAAFCPCPDHLSEEDKKYFFENAVKYDPVRTLYHGSDNKKTMPRLFVGLGKTSLPPEWQNYDWKRVEKEWQEYGEVRFFKPKTFIKE